jgi:integrase
MAAPRSATRRRRVQLALDGVPVVATLTEAQERRLRRTLAPFIAAARPGADATLPHLTSALRARRLQALFRLTDHEAAADAAEDAVAPELAELIERAAEVYARSLGDSTAAAYRRRWGHFTSWCETTGQCPLPATAEVVMLYMAALIAHDPPPALGTVRGRVSAINRMHAEADLPVPGDDPALRLMMRGLSRTVARPPVSENTAALRLAELRDILVRLDAPDPAQLRDSALLHLHAAGVSPGNLARLRWDNVTLYDDHVRLDLRPAYHRTADETVRLAAAEETRACPVTALRRWRDVAGSEPAQVFSGVDRHGRRHAGVMTAYALGRIITTRVESLAGSGALGDAVRVAARLLDQVGNDVLRDRAMLLLGWAGAFRRIEVTRLRWCDITVVEQGLIVRLRQSKTDRYHRGVDVGIPAGRSLLTCPVRAVLAWRQRMGEQLSDGFTDLSPCWPGIGKAGRIDPDHPLTPEGLTMMIRRRSAQAGLDARYGGRSLRAGFITTASELEVPMELIAAQSRHASLDNLARYIRLEDPFRRNAADRIGL